MLVYQEHRHHCKSMTKNYGSLNADAFLVTQNNSSDTLLVIPHTFECVILIYLVYAALFLIFIKLLAHCVWVSLSV